MVSLHYIILKKFPGYVVSQNNVGCIGQILKQSCIKVFKDVSEIEHIFGLLVIDLPMKCTYVFISTSENWANSIKQLIIDSIDTRYMMHEHTFHCSWISKIIHTFIYPPIHQEFIESLTIHQASSLGSPFKAESIWLWVTFCNWYHVFIF